MRKPYSPRHLPKKVPRHLPKKVPRHLPKKVPRHLPKKVLMKYCSRHTYRYSFSMI